MLTKNFYSFMRAVLQKASTTFTLQSGSTSEVYYNSSNSVVPFEALDRWAKTVSTTGVSFGTGTKPSTVSDYVLESILGDTQISVPTPSTVSYSRGDAFDEYSVSFGVTNITAEAITISEVGLTATPKSTNYVLVDRTLLDVPVTIPAHETKHIAYTIRFNY